MTSLTTKKVTVSAQSSYQEQFSHPGQSQFVYSYNIRIENVGSHPVKLLSRTWTVTDAAGERRHVEGEGVVGEQPTILPGESFDYTSWVQFETPIGAMEGNYYMMRTDANGHEVFFSVAVPRFLHVAPCILN